MSRPAIMYGHLFVYSFAPGPAEYLRRPGVAPIDAYMRHMAGDPEALRELGAGT